MIHENRPSPTAPSTTARSSAPEVLCLGTRGSRLALIQAHWVRERLLSRRPSLEVPISVIKTSADRQPDMSIRSGEATGVWVRELEAALLDGQIDVAVHSMKDLPTKIPPALEIGPVPNREDARDALVAGTGIQAISDLVPGSLIGTGSIRRQAQILAARPDLKVKEIRGNVDTRLQKLDRGDFDAVILACAGLIRLGLQNRMTAPLSLSEMLPAPGQGALGLEIRKDDSRVANMLSFLQHTPSAIAVLAERAFLMRMGGGCNSPIAVHADTAEDHVLIEGLVASPDGATIFRDSVRVAPSRAVEGAVGLAETLLARGGHSILSSLRRTSP
jgi:hydroxymethylbilane synthase